MQAAVLFAQAITKRREPTFSLSIEEDKDASRTNHDLHRVLVKFTNISTGFEVEQYHEESKGMYEMIVLRNGVSAPETDALRDLREYRNVDSNPTIQNPRLLGVPGAFCTS